MVGMFCSGEEVPIDEGAKGSADTLGDRVRLSVTQLPWVICEYAVLGRDVS